MTSDQRLPVLLTPYGTGIHGIAIANTYLYILCSSA